MGNIFLYVASSNDFNTLKATLSMLLLLKCSALIVFLLNFNLELHLENIQGKKHQSKIIIVSECRKIFKYKIKIGSKSLKSALGTLKAKSASKKGKDWHVP